MARKEFTPTERFWAKVATKGPGDCWLWTASTSTSGYGHIGVAGRLRQAHRFSWELHRGVIPAKMYILHRCDTPACVNPAHLFMGTHAENMADRNRKGRAAHNRGEQHGCAKLTEAQVLAIRDSTQTQKTLAAKYGVSISTISLILKRDVWTHLPHCADFQSR